MFDDLEIGVLAHLIEIIGYKLQSVFYFNGLLCTARNRVKLNDILREHFIAPQDIINGPFVFVLNAALVAIGSDAAIEKQSGSQTNEFLCFLIPIVSFRIIRVIIIAKRTLGELRVIRRQR